MSRRRSLAASLAGLALALAAAAPVGAQEQAEAVAPASLWYTLGTHGGPVPNADRSQPANLLLTGGEAILVDVGDGAAEQLAKLGIPLQRLSAVFISHLHFDHTGGLAAVLGLRQQTSAPGVLTIYGPPGTRAMVEGIVASMEPAARAGYGVPGESYADPAAAVSVVELAGGEEFALGAARITSAANSHYSFAPGSPQYGRFASLSFRFDLADRSILYTGDTGPSEAVEALGKGADLLVTEMIDVDSLLASMGPQRGDAPGGPSPLLVEHLRTHHVTPEDVGRMAKAMGVGAIAVTHLVIGNAGADDLRRYVATIKAEHDVPVVIARDLDAF